MIFDINKGDVLLTLFNPIVGVGKMKRNIMVTIVISLFVAMMVTLVQGQQLLSASDVAKLKLEAKEHYLKAVDYMDHVYMDGAIEELRKAASADPDNVNLQFLIASLARKRGKMETIIEKSQKYYAIAENALLAIQKQEKLTRDQRAYLESALKAVKKEKATLAQRNQRRLEVGYKIIGEFLKEIGKGIETKPKETPTAPTGGAVPVPSAPAAPLPPSPGLGPFGTGTSPAAPTVPTSPFAPQPPAEVPQPPAAPPPG